MSHMKYICTNENVEGYILKTYFLWKVKDIQSNHNGSDIFGIMEICSQYG